VKRLWLQSMTPGAIREGFAHLRDDEEMLPLANAARCRSEADWLIGINGTRAMTAFNSKEGGFYLTTVGRVQTPTLSIVVEREEKIRKFVPRDYWEVHAEFVCAAGIYNDARFLDLTEQAFRTMLDVNVVGTFIPAQEAARRMQAGGRIVTISSRGALGGTRFAHYVASKSAVIGLTRAMAMELRERQIAVNSVAPGFTDTPMTRSAPAEMFAAWEQLEPGGRAASPDVIANAIAFLAAPSTQFITGQTLFVDGGKSLGGLGI
jgi:NAD(P)-dependent dehydrogenase (short-subunit alcohol dehydrogenase family)